MKQFKYLSKIMPYIDDAFSSFYNTMLHDKRLSVFFEDDEHIKRLIVMQKNHFTASLNLRTNQLKESYVKLGEYHYDIRIPYIDFIKGTEILEEHFLLHTQKKEFSIELMDEIFEYFKLMQAYTAKGYLNRMLQEDKKDIESFFEQTTLDDNIYLPKALVLEKINWLKELLTAIENNTEFKIDDSKSSLLQRWVNELEFLTLEKRKFFEDIEQRIYINTQNLFYFLKREEYLEILPLYTSLLNVYKLTLMMNNAVTIEYANQIIEDMKFDSLTQLFRKEMFKELLKKEISLSQRESSYHFCVAYIDLDNFKGVNDNFGHYSGDKVIEKIGEYIRKNIRASDLGFRIGGDEFAIIIKKANKNQSKKVCTKIKADFSGYEFIFNEDVSFNVSLSIGITEYDNKNNIDIEEFIKVVDQKLYEAKGRGKNQIAL